MNWTATLGQLLGYDDVSNIASARTLFGSTWAHAAPGMVLLGCGGLTILSLWFYLRWQVQGQRATRLVLAILRVTTLCLAFLILTDPMLELTFVTRPKSVLWLLLDGSDSMSIQDDLSEDERDVLSRSVDFDEYLKSRPATTKSHELPVDASRLNPMDTPTRADYARALFSRANHNLVSRLSESFQVRAFAFGETEQVRAWPFDDGVEGPLLARDWETTGTTTALGEACEELSRRYSTDNLSAVLVFSDFDQNSGTLPLPAAKK